MYPNVYHKNRCIPYSHIMYLMFKKNSTCIGRRTLFLQKLFLFFLIQYFLFLAPLILVKHSKLRWSFSVVCSSHQPGLCLYKYLNSWCQHQHSLFFPPLVQSGASILTLNWNCINWMNFSLHWYKYCQIVPWGIQYNKTV